MSGRQLLILFDVLEVVCRGGIVYTWMLVTCAAIVGWWGSFTKFVCELFGWGLAVVVAERMQAKARELMRLEAEFARRSSQGEP